jgi:hypothetical protein
MVIADQVVVADQVLAAFEQSLLSPKPFLTTVSNFTLNLAALPRNNAAPFDNSGSLTFNNVNLVTNIAYSPTVGDAAALVSGGGQLTESVKINGVIVNQSDDVALNNDANVHPFKANYSAGGLSLSFDANPTIRLGASSAVGDDIVVRNLSTTRSD